MIDFKMIIIYSDTPEAKKAAELFSEEMKMRTNDVPDNAGEKESQHPGYLQRADRD